jgi:hypothetical protein
MKARRRFRPTFDVMSVRIAPSGGLTNPTDPGDNVPWTPPTTSPIVNPMDPGDTVAWTEPSTNPLPYDGLSSSA